MSVTDRTIVELERTIDRLVAYRDKAKEVNQYSGPEHATAFRATMDATRILAQWRRASVFCYPRRVK